MEEVASDGVQRVVRGQTPNAQDGTVVVYVSGKELAVGHRETSLDRLCPGVN